MSPLARRLLIAGIATTLVVAAVVAGLWLSGGGLADPGPEASESAAPPPPAGSAAGPVAGSEAIEVLEPGPVRSVATDEPPVTAGGSADVIVTHADWDGSSGMLEVAGFVSGVVEDGGTCRLTATSQGRTATTEAPGAADATTTSCGTLVIPRADLSSGTWVVVLGYESPQATGASAPASLSVTL
jgi:hypothetical protein